MLEATRISRVNCVSHMHAPPRASPAYERPCAGPSLCRERGCWLCLRAPASEHDRTEIRVGVEMVESLSPLEPIDNEIRQRRRSHLIEHLDDPLRQDRGDKLRRLEDARHTERQR